MGIGIDLTPTSSASDIETGDVISTGRATCGAGWLMCGNDVIGHIFVDRTTYAALFAVIGESFGVGDGSTSFEIPYIPVETFLTGVNVAGVGATGGSENHSHNGSDNSTGQSGINSTIDTGYASVSDSGHVHGVDTDGPFENSIGYQYVADDANTQTGYASVTDSGHAHGITDGGHAHSLQSGTTITDAQSHVPLNLRVNWKIKT